MLNGINRKVDELVYNMNKSLNLQPKLAGGVDIYIPPEESKFFKNQISKMEGKSGKGKGGIKADTGEYGDVGGHHVHAKAS